MTCLMDTWPISQLINNANLNAKKIFDANFIPTKSAQRSVGSKTVLEVSIETHLALYQGGNLVPVDNMELISPEHTLCNIETKLQNWPNVEILRCAIKFAKMSIHAKVGPMI